MLEVNLPEYDISCNSKESVNLYDFKNSQIIDTLYRMNIMSKQIIDTICDNINKAKQRKCFWQCHNRNLSAFVIYKTLKSMHIPRSIDYIAYYCNVTTNDIWRCESLDDKLSIPVDVEDILKSIYSQFDLSYKECCEISKLKHDFNSRSFSPFTLCGALLYYYCKSKKKKITMKAIAYVVKVSNVSTLRFRI